MFTLPSPAGSCTREGAIACRDTFKNPRTGRFRGRTASGAFPGAGPSDGLACLFQVSAESPAPERGHHAGQIQPLHPGAPGNAQGRPLPLPGWGSGGLGVGVGAAVQRDSAGKPPVTFSPPPSWQENADWNALLHDAGKRGAIAKTNGRTCEEELLKTLLKTLSQGPAMPDRTLPRPTGTTAGLRWGDAPSANSRTLPAQPAAAPAEGTVPGQPPPLPRDSSKKPPLPAQAKPPGERPQDPRLARRAEPAAHAGACREDPLPASSSGPGVALPQSPDAPPGQGPWSSITPPPASRGDAAGGQPQGACPPPPPLPPAGRDSDWRIRGTAGEAPTLDRRDPLRRSRDRGYPCPRGRRTSEEAPEGRGAPDPKRRRTTR